MRISAIALFAFLVIGCSGNDPELMLNSLQGYWEIKKVELADGQTRDFSVNTTIDYIQWDGKQGKRKKLSPGFNGSYTTSDQTETFTAEIRNGRLFLIYKTPYNQWEEEVIKANKTQLVVRNTDDKTYYYQPFESITLD